MPSHQEQVRQNNCEHDYRKILIMNKTYNYIEYEGLECKKCGHRTAPKTDA